MVNKVLIGIGVIILFFEYFITNLYITPQQKYALQGANYICNLEAGVFGINVPLGQVAQRVSPDLAQACYKVSNIMLLFIYEIFIYITGLILLIIGLSTGGKQIIKIDMSSSQYKETDNKSAKKTNFCKSCGKRISSSSARFCKYCGEKLF